MSKRELRLSTDWRAAAPPTYFINGTSRERVCRCGATFRCGGKGEPPATTRWCEPCRKLTKKQIAWISKHPEYRRKMPGERITSDDVEWGMLATWGEYWPYTTPFNGHHDVEPYFIRRADAPNNVDRKRGKR